MESNQILKAELIDIVFEGRNKNYGAYDLRKKYKERLMFALFGTIGSLVVIFLMIFLSSFFGSNKSKLSFDTKDTQLAEVKKDEPPPPPPPPPPPTPPPPPEVNQIKFTPPKIVKDEEVKPDEKIEEIKEDQTISNKTVETDNTDQIVNAVTEPSNVVQAPPAEDENKIFTKVEVEAGYGGGEAAWRKYLQNNLDGSIPGDKGAQPGSYTVVVRFIVARDGSISDVVAETNFGYGMEEESIRVIKKSGKWTPAIQNGKNVIAYKRQPITWLVQEQ
jgi:protein TonB